MQPLVAVCSRGEMNDNASARASRLLLRLLRRRRLSDCTLTRRRGAAPPSSPQPRTPPERFTSPHTALTPFAVHDAATCRRHRLNSFVRVCNDTELIRAWDVEQPVLK